MKSKLFFLLALIPFSAFAHDKEGWTLVWSEEFDYTGLPTNQKWSYDVGGHGWGNNELQYYTNSRIENVEVKNGFLNLTAINEDYQGNAFTSTRLVTRDKCDFQYGRLEIRAKLPDAVGTWPAI